MEYLIRFIQMHESFRKPETDALAKLAGLDIEWRFYSEDVGVQLFQ
jgi:tRNA (guanine10-N2)-methyltransferase